MLSQYSFIFHQMRSPFTYLRIKHNDHHLYTIALPLMFAIALSALTLLFVPHSSYAGQDGMIHGIAKFIGSLPGFFIAALAAVATFNKPDIDNLMQNPPEIPVEYEGQTTMVKMTRRRFLCVLFSYLAAMSITLIIATKIFVSISIPQPFTIPLSWLGVIAFYFGLSQMLVASMLGLYYLGERMHTPDPR